MTSVQFQALVRVIREHGFLQPILVRHVTDSGGGSYFEIVDGHHRVLAAQELGIQDVPMVDAT